MSDTNSESFKEDREYLIALLPGIDRQQIDRHLREDAFLEPDESRDTRLSRVAERLLLLGSTEREVSAETEMDDFLLVETSETTFSGSDFSQDFQSLKEILPDVSNKKLRQTLMKCSGKDRVERAVDLLMTYSEDGFDVQEVSAEDLPDVERVSIDEPTDPIEDSLEEKKKRKRKIDSSEIPRTETSKSPHLSEDQILAKFEELKQKFPDADKKMLFRRLGNGTPQEQIVAELETPNPDDFRSPSKDPEPSSASAGPSGIVRIPSVLKDKVDFLAKEDRRGLETILDAFPDVDPVFVLQKIVEEGKETERIFDELSRNPDYPKLKKRMEKERREKRRQEFLDRDSFDPEVYLRIFEDPETHFMNEGRNISALYVEHTRVQLMNDFPNMREDYITATMKENGNLYLPTLRVIEETQINARGHGGKGRKGPRKKKSQRGRPQFLAAGQDRTERVEWPEEIEETFFRELQYALYEQEIKEYKRNGEIERGRRLARAREQGILEECQCCFDDECLPEDMIPCRANRHKFCHNCIRTHAETQIGDGHHRIKCLSDECEDGSEIPLESLRSLLSPNVIDVILKRVTEEEVRSADLENIHSCPFCHFAAIVENQQDRVFRCLNPECLKESCRECKLESHIPLKCSEVEKPDVARMRNFIADKMSDAMIRVCPTCGKRLLKSGGCNKMTCACGAFICYVCSKLLDKRNPYSHFDQRGGQLRDSLGATTSGKRKCPCTTSIEQVHADVAEKAGKTAKEQYLKEHPELNDQEKNDVRVEQLVDRGEEAHRFAAEDSDPEDSDLEMEGDGDSDGSTGLSLSSASANEEESGVSETESESESEEEEDDSDMEEGSEGSSPGSSPSVPSSDEDSDG